MTGITLKKVDEQFAEYLRDESRRTGEAEEILFARSEQEIRQALALCSETGKLVTIQGARTGITAGAVPQGGLILNLSKMRAIIGLRKNDQGRFVLIVQPGITLSDLNSALLTCTFETRHWSTDSCTALEKLRASGRHFFTPDPTETSASVGGMVACNASGARTFLYGPTAPHIIGLRICLASGEMFDISRGQVVTRGGNFSITTESGTTISGNLPTYRQPSGKSVAGYHVSDTMDLIDLFIGSEGTLGVVTQVDLELTPLPRFMWGLMIFMPSEESALRVVNALRHPKQTRPAAIEFFNSEVLDLLRNQRATNPAFSKIPEMPAEYHTALYIEYHGETEDDVSEALMSASEIMVEAGGREEATWSAMDDAEMSRLKFFRHAVPESVNLLIDERRKNDSSIVKLGTDMAVLDERLEAIMNLYDEGIKSEGLQAVIFGHIGNNHLHVNIIPRSSEELHRGKALYRKWAQTVVSWGGTVSAEHGIGKSKTEFLELMYGHKSIEEMKELKRLFDPKGILNRGNIFVW